MVCVVADGRTMAVDSRVVVLVETDGVGFSTTVVQEVRTVATSARAGVRIRSFFIMFGWFLTNDSGSRSVAAVFSRKIFCINGRVRSKRVAANRPDGSSFAHGAAQFL